MSLPAFACRRRVTVGMAAVTLLLFGAIGLSNLRVDLLPPLAFPTLTVRTEYVGAAPAEIELLVTEPIEEVVGVVKNLRRISSVSRAGLSDVTLEFAWGTDMDQASIEVREKLELLNLPVEAGHPQLLRFDPASEPVLRLALVAPGADAIAEAELMRMRRLADEQLRRGLETVPGVAAARVAGGLVEEVEVAFDPERLRQLGLSVAEMIERLRAENVNLAAGRLGDGAERYLLRTRNQFLGLEEIRSLPLRARGGEVVRVGDVARVARSFRDREAIIRLDGREAVEIALYKEGDANTVAVSDAVAARLDRLRAQLPAGLALRVVDDQAGFIRAALAEVRTAAMLGGLLAVLVVGLFLRDARSTAIIAVSIPVSIAGAFFLMEQAGVGLNLMSLGGLALAVGMVVDGAIVVLESIARHREAGLAPAAAAEEGAGRVAAAVTASVLTTVSVFLPLVFVEGVAGQLFRDQALTVAFAMLVSLFVALAVIPMLAARTPEPLPPPPPRPPRGALRRGLQALARLPAAALGFAIRSLRATLRALARLLDPLAAAVQRGYLRIAAAYLAWLPRALERRDALLSATGLAFAAALAALPALGFDLVPQFVQDRFQLTLRLAPGTPLAVTDAIAAEVARAETGRPPVASVHAVSGLGARLDANPVEVGENVARLLVILEPGAGRAGEAEVMERMRAGLAARPGVEAEFARPALFDLARPLEVELVGSDTEHLREASQRLIARMAATGRFSDLRASIDRGQPEVRIEFDQERLAALGLTSRQVADQVVRAVRGEVATRLRNEDRRIDIVVRLPAERRASLADLERLPVPGSARPVRLAEVARLRIDESPAEIRRVDQQRVAVVAAQYRHRDLASALAELRELLAEPLAPGVGARLGAQSEQLGLSRDSLIFTLALAVFLVYLVMAAQFESLLHPFVILLTVPLALIGVVLSLALLGLPLSAMAMIGLILLAGIVVNNAIVLIDRINQLRVEGSARRAAILRAAEERLRPILMTTLTTVLGFLPMALAGGEGAELRRPLAVTVVGGLSVATLLTLFVIPALYELLDRKSEEAFARLRMGAEAGA